MPGPASDQRASRLGRACWAPGTRFGGHNDRGLDRRDVSIDPIVAFALAPPNRLRKIFHPFREPAAQFPQRTFVGWSATEPTASKRRAIPGRRSSPLARQTTGDSYAWFTLSARDRCSSDVELHRPSDRPCIACDGARRRRFLGWRGWHGWRNWRIHWRNWRNWRIAGRIDGRFGRRRHNQPQCHNPHRSGSRPTAPFSRAAPTLQQKRRVLPVAADVRPLGRLCRQATTAGLLLLSVKPADRTGVSFFAGIASKVGARRRNRRAPSGGAGLRRDNPRVASRPIVGSGRRHRKSSAVMAVAASASVDLGSIHFISEQM
jgi:hypothetical protein